MPTTLILTPGLPFEPDKCPLCGGKLPPHPPTLRVALADGTFLDHQVCPKCEQIVTKIATMVGQEPVTFDLLADHDGAYRQETMDFHASASDEPGHGQP